MGTVIGPQMFFLGWNGAGITMTGGHETMLFTAWFGQYLYSDHRRANATGTAIQIFGNDHYVWNTIVFGGKIGVHVKNPATIVSGVHTWNLGTSYGGIGILNEATQNRFLGCYLDGNDLWISSPIEDVSVEDGFFLYDAQIILNATKGNSQIHGLSIHDNQFFAYTGSVTPTIALNEQNGNYFKNISQVVIQDNLIYGPRSFKQAKVSKSVRVESSSMVQVNFTDELLFDLKWIPIAWIDYTVQFNDVNQAGMFIGHSLSEAKNGVVTIQFSQASDVTVYVTVDQSLNASQ